MNVFPQKDRKQQYICVQRLRGFHLNPPGHRYSIIKKHCHHQCGQPFIKSLKLYGESHSGLSQHHTCTLSSHMRNSHVTDSHTMGRRLKTVPQLYEEKCYKDNWKKKDREQLQNSFMHWIFLWMFIIIRFKWRVSAQSRFKNGLFQVGRKRWNWIKHSSKSAPREQHSVGPAHIWYVWISREPVVGRIWADNMLLSGKWLS